MAYPPPYTRTVSFQEWQALHPGEPLPGTDVDGEFDDVSLALTATQANLALIQRADGELANNSVGVDQLEAGLFDHVADSVIAAAAVEADRAESAATVAEGYKNAANLSAQAAQAYANAAALDAARVTTTADEALASATVASQAEIVAQNASIAATNDASHAAQSATDAERWADEAEKWAEYLAGPVQPAPPGWPEAVDDGMFSAKWWAIRARTILEDAGVGVPIPPASVWANPTGAPALPIALQATNDNTILRRVGGVLDFGLLTSAMFPAGVIPPAALPPIPPASLPATVVYTDATQTFTGVNTFAQPIVLPDGSIPYVDLAVAAGVSVLGRAAGTPGALAPIVALADGDVLQRVGGALVFAPAPGGGGGLSPIAPFSVLANPTGVAALPIGVAALADDTIFRRVAGVLEWGALTSAMFTAGIIPPAALPPNIAFTNVNNNFSAPQSFNSGAAANTAVFNSAHALGPYVTFARSGVSFGYIGNGSQMGTGFTADSMALDADIGKALELGTSNTMRLRIAADGVVSFSAANVGNLGYSFTNTDPAVTAYVALRLLNSAGQGLVIARTSPAYATSFFLGGPAGNQAAIGTEQAVQLVFGTANTARMVIAADGTITMNGVNATDFARLSQTNTFTDIGGFGQRIAGPGIGTLLLEDTSAAANSKLWRLYSAGGSFGIQGRTDGNGALSNPLTIVGAGLATATAIQLVATAITLNGVAASDFARLSVDNVFSSAGNNTQLIQTTATSGLLARLQFATASIVRAQIGVPLNGASFFDIGTANALAIRTEATPIEFGIGSALAMLIDTSGIAAFTNPTTTLSQFSSSHAQGGFLRIARNGATFMFIGNASAVSGRTLDAGQIYANTALYLHAAGGIVYLNDIPHTDFARLSIANTFVGANTFQANPAIVHAGQSALVIQSTDAANAVLIFGTAGASRAVVGSPGAPNALLSGDQVGDLDLYCVSGSFRFSGNNGVATHLIITNVGSIITPNARADEVGYKALPAVNIGGNYSTALSDASKMLVYTGPGGGEFIQIDIGQGYPDGSQIVMCNRSGGPSLIVAVSAGGTLTWAGVGTVGNRNLAANGIATFTKMPGSNTWLVIGAGLS